MALTASSLIQESLGSLKLHIATFASVTTAYDVYSSGIPGIVAVWAVATSASSGGSSSAIAAGVTTASTGVVTLAASDYATSAKLFIVSKS